MQKVIFGDFSILVGQLGDLSHFIFRHSDPVLAEYFDLFPHRYAAVAVFIWDGFLAFSQHSYFEGLYTKKCLYVINGDIYCGYPEFSVKKN